MPHDANGTEIKPGDILMLEVRVNDVYAAEDYCNVNVETVEKPVFADGVARTEKLSAINSRNFRLLRRASAALLLLALLGFGFSSCQETSLPPEVQAQIKVHDDAAKAAQADLDKAKADAAALATESAAKTQAVLDLQKQVAALAAQHGLETEQGKAAASQAQAAIEQLTKDVKAADDARAKRDADAQAAASKVAAENAAHDQIVGEAAKQQADSWLDFALSFFPGGPAAGTPLKKLVGPGLLAMLFPRPREHAIGAVTSATTAVGNALDMQTLATSGSVYLKNVASAALDAAMAPMKAAGLLHTTSDPVQLAQNALSVAQDQGHAQLANGLTNALGQLSAPPVSATPAFPASTQLNPAV